MGKNDSLERAQDGRFSATRESFFSVDQMYEKVRRTALTHGLEQTKRALPLARRLHEGQIRKGRERVPYLYHPLLMAVHAISLGLTEDELLASCLLHDVCEDCHIRPQELEVSRRVQKTVAALTRPENAVLSPEEKLEIYYQGIRTNPQACLVKVLDRCGNVSQMSAVFGREKMREYLRETTDYVMPLLEVAAERDRGLENACFALRYHLLSVITTIESLIGPA